MHSPLLMLLNSRYHTPSQARKRSATHGGDSAREHSMMKSRRGLCEIGAKPHFSHSDVDMLQFEKGSCF